MVLAPPVLLGADYRMLVEVPVGRAYVGLFHSADCSGPPKPVPLAYQAVFYGVYLEGLPAGFVSMRSFRQDGGADPCSNAVPWR